MPNFEFKTGEYSEKVYFVSARADPTFDAPEDFAVTLYYNDTDLDENIQVARIDNSHGYVHFDRLYRRDEPKEEMSLTFWEAVEHIEENWRTYAKSYEAKDG